MSASGVCRFLLSSVNPFAKPPPADGPHLITGDGRAGSDGGDVGDGNAIKLHFSLTVAVPAPAPTQLYCGCPRLVMHASDRRQGRWGWCRAISSTNPSVVVVLSQAMQVSSRTLHRRPQRQMMCFVFASWLLFLPPDAVNETDVGGEENGNHTSCVFSFLRYIFAYCDPVDTTSIKVLRVATYFWSIVYTHLLLLSGQHKRRTLPSVFAVEVGSHRLTGKTTNHHTQSSLRHQHHHHRPEQYVREEIREIGFPPPMLM